MSKDDYLNVRNLDDAYDNIAFIKKKLKKVGYPISRYIGEGDYGIAYSTPDKKVLKITTDPNEAKVSARLQSKKFKNVINIYRVFELKSVKGVSFILQERLTDISNNMGKVFNGLIIKDGQNITTKDISKFLKKAKDLQKAASEREYFENFNMDKDIIEEAEKFLKSPLIKSKAFLGYLVSLILEERFDLLSYFNKKSILNMMNDAFSGLEELRNAGIVFRDTHSGNLMKNKTYKWIDLGAGSQGKTEGVEIL